jgi:hypothetical protein
MHMAAGLLCRANGVRHNASSPLQNDKVCYKQPQSVGAPATCSGDSRDIHWATLAVCYRPESTQTTRAEATDVVSHWKGNMVPDQIQDGLRPLRLEEDSFIRALLRRARDGERLLLQLERAQVLDMNDGKMGSVQFFGRDNRFLGSCLAEEQYVDLDGVPVSIVLNADTTGQLYELDIWKADFSPLQAYPVFERVTVKS